MNEPNDDLEVWIAAGLDPASAIAATQNDAPKASDGQPGINAWLIVGLVTGLVVSLFLGL